MLHLSRVYLSCLSVSAWTSRTLSFLLCSFLSAKRNIIDKFFSIYHKALFFHIIHSRLFTVHIRNTSLFIKRCRRFILNIIVVPVYCFNIYPKLRCVLSERLIYVAKSLWDYILNIYLVGWLTRSWSYILNPIWLNGLPRIHTGLQYFIKQYFLRLIIT